MNTDLTELIRSRREHLGYSKARLARDAGISDGYLVQIESGQRRPSMGVLTRLAAALSLPAVHLWEAAGLVGHQEYEVALAEVREVAWKAMGEVVELDRLGADVPSAVADNAESAMSLWLTAALAGMPGSATAPPAEPAPEGWSDLSANDRRLVQQLVNRLRASSSDG